MRRIHWISGNHDKAWNDPPVFAYDAASAAQAKQKRTPLNKRVAFPVTGTAGQGSPLLSGQGPPPMAPGQGPPPLRPGQGPPPMASGQAPPPMLPGQAPPPMLPGQAPPPMLPGQGPPPMLPGQGPPPTAPGQGPPPKSSGEEAPVLSAAEIKAKLLSILDGLDQIEAKLKDDITLRVDVICCVLDADRLSAPVQQRLSQLVNALSEGSVETADRLQRSLMVDYPGECGSWMPGIRQLIVQLSPATAGVTPGVTPDVTPVVTPGEGPATDPSADAPES
ncbi:Steroid receptor RNA activator 1 [Amphibalanus amphitrite]|uniref:Steroid receptor RNA activator 1 n=1 Tax=Amphibalanus amphitrite TaxID=1232801 RepID=A0A6A4WP91_AMPAM|nr:Steroid receptor RNA activator 1 [Amphibalanus amphitrite]